MAADLTYPVVVDVWADCATVIVPVDLTNTGPVVAMMALTVVVEAVLLPTAIIPLTVCTVALFVVSTLLAFVPSNVTTIPAVTAAFMVVNCLSVLLNILVS